jgi:hypothetical protein
MPEISTSLGLGRFVEAKRGVPSPKIGGFLTVLR